MLRISGSSVARWHGDHSELVDASENDPHNVQPVDQLVILDRVKGEHHVRLSLTTYELDLNAGTTWLIHR